jgi:hypothetical protein
MYNVLCYITIIFNFFYLYYYFFFIFRNFVVLLIPSFVRSSFLSFFLSSFSPFFLSSFHSYFIYLFIYFLCCFVFLSLSALSFVVSYHPFFFLSLFIYYLLSFLISTKQIGTRHETQITAALHSVQVSWYDHHLMKYDRNYFTAMQFHGAICNIIKLALTERIWIIDFISV